MKTFSNYLYEAVNYTTKEDIKKAIDKFDSLPSGKQASEARKILKAAEKVDYVVKAQKILAYKSGESKTSGKEDKLLTKYWEMINNLKNVKKEVEEIMFKKLDIYMNDNNSKSESRSHEELKKSDPMYYNLSEINNNLNTDINRFLSVK